jgi:hypothetical protein
MLRNDSLRLFLRAGFAVTIRVVIIATAAVVVVVGRV